ncbi:MAG: Hsp70 family protein [Candidatus Promineifilaceae bacterium]
MIVGMDFGTTNSGMAVYDGQHVQMLPLDSAGANPEVARTALYVTNDQTVTIGREAVDRYFEENVGRPVKMKKVWVGEVEVYGADMYYVTDVYAWIDALSPGRLFLSIKSGLRDPEYQGTVVGQIYYSLEDLIACYLSLTRMRAERYLGREVREVVLGRPVRFATNPEADELAQGRLLEAAFRAGYEKVYLQYEPIAAAYAYAMTINEPQNILVFDFGGGTLDITVMRLGSRGEREVLATGGIPIAGDIFDQKLVRAKLPRHFGEGSRYGLADRQLPLPKWIFDVFSNWQKVFELQTLESREFLREIASTSSDKRGVKALISMVTNNYTLHMFDVVEAAKQRLSEEMASLIRLDGPGFHVTELITRTAFEQIIMNEIQTIGQHLDETVQASGLSADDFDAVIRTGGSSNIPAFRYMLMDKYGREKVQATDIFNSVASGLGIIAKGISNGDISARAFTPADQPHHSDATQQQKVAAVNLSLLQKRMASREGSSHGDTRDTQGELIVLDGDGRLGAIPLAGDVLDGPSLPPLPFELSKSNQIPVQIIPTKDSNQQMLLITSMYRLLLTTSGNLLDLQELGMEIGEFYQLKKDEFVSSIGLWSVIKGQRELLIVTSKGYARTYRLDRLIETIEGPTPLKFDRPLVGLPLSVYGVDRDSDLILVSDSGRAVRYPLDALPSQGIQAFSRRDDERLVGAIIGGRDGEFLVVTQEGFGRRLAFDSIPEPAKPNSRGKVIISRKPVAGIAGIKPNQSTYAITEREVIPFDPLQLALDDPTSTISYPITELRSGRSIYGLMVA